MEETKFTETAVQTENTEIVSEEVTTDVETAAKDIASAEASPAEDTATAEASPAEDTATAEASPAEGTATAEASPAKDTATAEAVPTAPEETMADYAEELEASYRQIHEGDILTGTVIGVSETEITLDFGYYTDGIIHLEDTSDDPTFSLKDRIQPGQTLSATVIRRDDGAGHILLSMKEAAAVMAWDRLEELQKSQDNITVKISGITKAGAIAYVEGIRGFIPASKLALGYVEENDLESWLNKSIEVRVVTADEDENRLVLSAKEILREAEAEEKKKLVSSVTIGLVTEGTVETLMPYGAFVDLGKGLSGLIHISQISNTRIKHPGVVLKEGQKVKVKIIDVKDGKISLSMKALEEAAAEAIEEESFELPETEAATTSLGSLFANLKLN